MPYNRPAIRGRRVGGGPGAALPEPTHTPAERILVTFVCVNPKCVRKTLVVTFAKGVVPWDAAECPCGAKALREGAPADAKPFLPAYSSIHGGQARNVDHGIDPQSQLRKRRTAEEGEELLDEALRARWGAR